jgi:hypothetical protein
MPVQLYLTPVETMSELSGTQPMLVDAGASYHEI